MNATTHPKRRPALLAIVGVLAVLASVGLPPSAANAAPPAGTITGRVSLGVAGQYAGAGEVVVTLDKYDHDTNPQPLPGVSATTDASGVYTISGLENSRYDVKFSYVGSGPYMPATTPYSALFPGTEFDTTIPYAYVIAGRVSLDTAGHYASAGEVRVRASNGGVSYTALTDADGRYDLGRVWLREGGWELRFEYLGTEDYPLWYYTGDSRGARSSSYRVTASVDRTDYDVVVGAGVSLSGRMVTSSGAPVVGQEIRVLGINPMYGYITDAFTTTTTATGTYRVRALPNGWSYVVAFGQSTTDGYAADTATAGNVSGGGDIYRPANDQWISGIDATMYLESTITADVSWPSSLSGSMDGPGSSMVFIERFDPATSTWSERSIFGTLSSTVHTATLTERLPGRYRVSVDHLYAPDAYPPVVSAPFMLGEDQDAIIQLVLVPDATPTTAISSLHADMGGDAGTLGPAVAGIQSVPGGGYRRFAHGTIYSSTASGTWAVMAGMLSAYVANGASSGALGWPVGPQRCSVTTRCWQEFTGGIIATTPMYGAHVLWGGFKTHWLDTGETGGPYGGPVNELSAVSGPLGSGWQQNFENGVLTQSASGFRLVPYGSVLQGWLARGGGAGSLGWPVDASTCAGGNCAQEFAGGLLTSSPYGPQSIHGGFIEEWKARGGLSGLGVAYGPLRYASGAQQGWAQNFAAGILTQSSAGFQLLPYGRIQALWSSTGESRGYGWPAGNPSCTSFGCTQPFTGAILSDSSWGTYAIVGGLGVYWRDHSGATAFGPAINPLRYSAASGGGYIQHFRDGVITQTTAGQTVFTPYSPILSLWYYYGGEQTWLGWPTAAPVCAAGACTQQFQNGVARSDVAGNVTFSRA